MMLTDIELESLLLDLESDRVERKRSISDGQSIRKAICAFANDLPDHRRPGVIFIGINDDGSCAGIEINDDLLRTVANWCNDGSILPRPDCTIQVKTLSNCRCVVAEINPSLSPPVRLSGRVWVRIGPTLASASPEQESRLAEKRRFFDVPYDARPAPGIPLLENLDLDFFRKRYLPAAVSAEVLEQNQRTEIEQLASLKMINDASECYITVTGMLVLGGRVVDFIPGAYIQFVRFDGQEMTDPIIDSKATTGNIVEQIRFIEEVFTAHIRIASDLSGPTEIKTPDYPLEALKEVLRNAILHRTYEGTHAPVKAYWYSDRVEIISPGGLYGKVNATNFGDSGLNDYRNPNLAEAMKYLGYIQKFGFGLQKVKLELEKNGNPPFEFVDLGTFVRIIIRKRIG